MINKEYLRKVYKKFSDLVSISAARELEYFILDSKFTTSFNYRMKELVEDLKDQGLDDIDGSVLFNTRDEIAIIDANILGKYIGNNYNLTMEEYYKNVTLNRVIREVINGSDKAQHDFVIVSFSILYNTLRHIYKEIKCKKEMIDRYRRDYFLLDYRAEDIGAVIACILILEDICKYIGISEIILARAVREGLEAKKL